MALAKARSGYVFYVNTSGAHIAVPSSKNILNAFDYLGQLVGVKRIPGERNAAYRERIWDVYVHRAGSNITGLTNGIIRELGLSRFNAVTITTTDPVDSRIIVSDTTLELYNPATTLLKTIDIYSRTSPAYFLSGLVAEATAGVFTAVLEAGVYLWTPSATLLRDDSHVVVMSEPLKGIHRNLLENDNLVRETVRFPVATNGAFSVEKATESLVLAAGDYWVDYTNGVIYSYSLPLDGTGVSYVYNSLDQPMTLEASQVVLQEFGADSFRDKIFRQVLLEDGSYIDGLPLHEAMDYINELLQVKGMLWGE